MYQYLFSTHFEGLTDLELPETHFYHHILARIVQL